MILMLVTCFINHINWHGHTLWLSYTALNDNNLITLSKNPSKKKDTPPTQLGPMLLFASPLDLHCPHCSRWMPWNTQHSINQSIIPGPENTDPAFLTFNVLTHLPNQNLRKRQFLYTYPDLSTWNGSARPPYMCGGKSLTECLQQLTFSSKLSAVILLMSSNLLEVVITFACKVFIDYLLINWTSCIYKELQSSITTPSRDVIGSCDLFDRCLYEFKHTLHLMPNPHVLWSKCNMNEKNSL